MASGRKRGGIRQRGWLHRGLHHQSEQSVDASDDAGADPGEAEGGSGAGEHEGESEGHRDVQDAGGDGTPPGPDSQASLDQVLRSAAKARDKGGDKDGAG